MIRSEFKARHVHEGGPMSLRAFAPCFNNEVHCQEKDGRAMGKKKVHRDKLLLSRDILYRCLAKSKDEADLCLTTTDYKQYEQLEWVEIPKYFTSPQFQSSQ
jgi:hypothetical protein